MRYLIIIFFTAIIVNAQPQSAMITQAQADTNNVRLSRMIDSLSVVIDTLTQGNSDRRDRLNEIVDSLNNGNADRREKLGEIIDTLNNGNSVLRTKLSGVIDSLNTLINFERRQSTALIGGTAANSWTQLGENSCNGFEIHNNGEATDILKIAFSSSPSYFYTLYGKDYYRFKLKNTNKVYIKGDNVDYFIRRY